jgi:molybdopterin-guanine dinucleotide biosynthesis protein A
MDAVILAGGENRRMPVPKGLLEIEGQRIIERNVILLRKLFDRIYISTNTPELYFSLGAILVGDVMKHKGPMTGIYSILAFPDVSEIFVTACDMPYVNVILIQYLVKEWENKWDALIPVYADKPEPLFGIYSKRIVRKMEGSIKSGKRSLHEFLRRINVLYVSEEEVRRRDPEGKSFVNINTVEDFQKETGGRTCLV